MVASAGTGRVSDAAGTAPPFHLENVSFTYSSATEPTLHDIDLTVNQGEFVGIVGATASGKSTLLYILAGAIPHFFTGSLEGTVEILGRPSHKVKLANITSDCGLVLQDPEVQLFNIFVKDELVWGLENRGVPRPEMDVRRAEALGFFNIGHLEDRISYDLSGGEKQKVALASIYAIKPGIFLFDNPTSQLDPLGSRMVFEGVEKLAHSRRHTIVMVEDKIEELLEHCDRLVLLHEGTIILDAPPREFARRRDLLDRAGVMGSRLVELAIELEAGGASFDTFPITLDELARACGDHVKAGRTKGGPSHAC